MEMLRVNGNGDRKEVAIDNGDGRDCFAKIIGHR